MTTAKSRVDKVESALHPREAVLAWLAEVQDLSHISEYSQHVAAAHIDDAPMSVIGRRVRARVREDMKGRPRNEIDAAAYRAFGDSLFLVSLVFQLNIDAVQTAQREGLRATAAVFWMGCLLSGPRDDQLEPEAVEDHHRQLDESWTPWFSVIDRLRRDVDIADGIRAAVGERYYGGHDVLFADARSDWAEHVEQVERIGRLADMIAESPSGKAARDKVAVVPPDAIASVIDANVEYFVDQAKVRAFDALDERPKAVAIMERQIRNGFSALSVARQPAP
jgi:hypothetical protein